MQIKTTRRDSITNIWLAKAKRLMQSSIRKDAMWETQVRFLGREDPLEKEMAIHSSTLVWKIPWTEEPDRLQSMGSQRVGYDWAISLSLSLSLEHSLALPFFGIGIKTDIFQSCGHCWVFQIWWHIVCSTSAAAASFRILNNSAGIPSTSLVSLHP